MKINVITSPFGDLPPRALGAVEKLFYQLAGVWGECGHEVCILCAGGGADERLQYVRLGRYKRTGRTLTDLPFDLWYSVKAILVMPKCDVLVCNTFWSPILAPLVRWKYKKLVYGVHRHPKGQFWLYRFVHSFICVSTAIGDAVKAQCRATASKVWVICNPIDTDVFTKTKEGLSNSDNEIRIVYSGRIAKEKGIVDLAEATRDVACDEQVARGRQVRLILVGPWESSLGGGGESYRQKILTIFPAAEFMGSVYEPRRIAEIIQLADVYCYPTIAEKGEAMPVAPLEAMACGVPVVLPRFKCFADYARDAENCLMYDDPAELENMVKRVLRDKDLADKIAINAACSVEPFSIEKTAQKYMLCFKSM